MSAARGDMRGFTLIEVLVALLVVALGMGALLTTIASSAETVGRLRDSRLRGEQREVVRVDQLHVGEAPQLLAALRIGNLAIPRPRVPPA